MDHPSRQQLSQLNLGLLNSEESEKIAGHVDACAACRDALVAIGASERDSLIEGIQAPHEDSFGEEPERADALQAARPPFQAPNNSSQEGVLSLDLQH